MLLPWPRLMPLTPGILLAAPCRTHHALGWDCNGERRSGADAGRSSPRFRLSAVIQHPGARRTAPRAGQRNRKSRMGGWRKAQLAQGVIPGRLLRGGNGKHGGERGPADSQDFSYRPDGNRVARMSVRPVAKDWPERVEPAAPLLMFDSYAAGVKEQPELFGGRSRRRMRIAKPVEPLRQVDPMGSGNPGCRDVSVCHLRCNCDAPLGGDSTVGRVPGETHRASRRYGFRLGRREGNPQTPQPGWERSAAKRSVPAAWQRRRSTSATWRVPSSRRDQLRAAERCPGKKDLNTPATGLAGNEGLKHPVTPARAACEGLEHPALAAFPRGPRLSAGPGLREGPPDFYGGKPGKA